MVAFQITLIVGEYANKLVSYIVRLFQRSKVKVVVPAPIRVHIICLERIEDVKHRDVVTIRMGEL